MPPDTLSVEAPARMLTSGHVISSLADGVVAEVGVAAALALLRKALKLGAGVESDDEQPDIATPSATAAAAGRHRLVQVSRIATPPMHNA